MFNEPTEALAYFPAWLQAGAAVVSVVFAYLMYRITQTYVKATQAIAIATGAQVEVLRASLSSEPNRALALTTFEQRLSVVQNCLQTLPGPGSQQVADRIIRNATLFTEDDLEELARSAAALGAATAALAGKAIQNLRWLRDRAIEVRETSPARGFDWQSFRWGRWALHYGEAESALRQFVGETVALDAC